MSLKSKLLPGRAALLTALLALLCLPAVIALAAPSTASACPPQGCHVPPDDDPPPHPPPGPPPPKYRITIDKLVAHVTEDDTGINDEAYIRVKGTKVWGVVSINPYQAQYPNVSLDVTGPIWVSLYDEDDGFWTRTTGSATRTLRCRRPSGSRPTATSSSRRTTPTTR